MAFTVMTEKEVAFLQCAHMILEDQCPPEREHYLCMQQEDETGDCAQCWNNYLWGLSMGTIEPYKAKRGGKAVQG